MHKVRNLALFLQKSAILDARFLVLLIIIINDYDKNNTNIISTADDARDCRHYA